MIDDSLAQQPTSQPTQPDNPQINQRPSSVFQQSFSQVMTQAQQPQTAPQAQPQSTQAEQSPPTQASAPQQQSQPPEPQASQPVQSNGPEESPLFPGQYRPMPEEVVFEWTAPNRPFKKRNRQFYTTVAIITLLISLILFFAGQFLPIAVVIAVAFLAYVLSSVPPEMVVSKITTYGIRYENAIYYWEELGRFWFDKKFDQSLVHIELGRFPGRITLMLGEASEAELTEILSEVLMKEKPADTPFDKMAKWLTEKIPLETV